MQHLVRQLASQFAVLSFFLGLHLGTVYTDTCQVRIINTSCIWWGVYDLRMFMVGYILLSYLLDHWCLLASCSGAVRLLFLLLSSVILTEVVSHESSQEASFSKYKMMGRQQKDASWLLSWLLSFEFCCLWCSTFTWSSWLTKKLFLP